MKRRKVEERKFRFDWAASTTFQTDKLESSSTGGSSDEMRSELEDVLVTAGPSENEMDSRIKLKPLLDPVIVKGQLIMLYHFPSQYLGIEQRYQTERLVHYLLILH